MRNIEALPTTIENLSKIDNQPMPDSIFTLNYSLIQRDSGFLYLVH